MAKTKLNKSAKIREVIQADSSASPSAIVAKLAEAKIKVSPTLVSNVKARMAGGAKRKRGRPPKHGAGQLSIEGLLAAKKFADHFGSVSAAKQALDALAKLS